MNLILAGYLIWLVVGLVAFLVLMTLTLIFRRYILWLLMIERAVMALESIAESQRYLAQAEEWKITRVQQSTSPTARVAGGGPSRRP